jgi:uncharacterized protein YdiU (UPF0061 family)
LKTSRRLGCGICNVWRSRCRRLSALSAECALDDYQHALLTVYGRRMRDKLGLFTQQKGDNDLLDGLFALMIREGSDYTRTFRMLSASEQTAPPRRCAMSLSTARPSIAGLPAIARACAMNRWTMRSASSRCSSVNPALVLRNWLAQRAIEQAEQGI